MTQSDIGFWGFDVPMGIILFTLVFSCVFAAFRLFFNILRGKAAFRLFYILTGKFDA